MKSINSAAVALAEAAAGSEEAFVVLMNRKAREIGAGDTPLRERFGPAEGETVLHRQRPRPHHEGGAFLSAHQGHPGKEDVRGADVRWTGDRPGELEPPPLGGPDAHHREDRVHGQRAALLRGRHGHGQRHGHHRRARRTVADQPLEGGRDARRYRRASRACAAPGRATGEPGRKAGPRKNKTMTAGVGNELVVPDFQKSWVLRGFSQQLTNN